MAISAATIWEVRTTGNQNNGGGFVAGATGTDYSQQDDAEDSGTDLACADGDLASPVITSATHNFIAADVGNIIHITAGTGWTAGWYEIVSVDTNAATLDRACGTDGAKTGGTWYLGGAFAITGNLASDFFGATAKTAGNTVYIKNGTHALGETISAGADGTTSAPIKVIGYKSTRGDAPTLTDRPLINCAALTINCAQYFFWENLSFTGTSGSRTVYTAAGEGINKYINCKFHNTSTGSCFEMDAGTNYFIGCEFIAAGGTGLEASNTSCFVYGCYFHDSVIGIDSTSGGGVPIINCVFDTCSSYGIYAATSNPIIVNCTIYNCAIGIGVTTVGTPNLINNIISGCTSYGLSSSGTAYSYYSDFNLWHNDTDIGGTNYVKGANDVTDDPLLTAPATGTFSIGSDSPAANTALDASTFSGCSV